MPVAKLTDCEIYYEVFGEGEPLILVAGLGGVGNYWLPNIDAFSEKFRVVIYDHRGTGKSTRSRAPYTVDQMTGDLIGLMDHLSIESAHLLGHSTGGAIGQTIAAEHPQRLKSLILYSTWTKADPFFKRVFEARRKLLTESGVLPYIRSTPIFLYPDWWINSNIQKLEEREAALEPVFPSAEIAASRIDAIVDFDRTSYLPRFTTPTCIVCAKDDILTPPYFSQELADLIPDSQANFLEKGGHCASETATEDFNDVVLRFLNSQPIQTSG